MSKTATAEDMKHCNHQRSSFTKFKFNRVSLVVCVITLLSSLVPIVKAQETAGEAVPGAAEVDEFGNVIIKQRVYTDKELAALQAIYP